MHDLSLQTCVFAYQFCKSIFNRILFLQACAGFGKKPHEKDITLLKNCRNERSSCISYNHHNHPVLRTGCKSVITPTLRSSKNASILPTISLASASNPYFTDIALLLKDDKSELMAKDADSADSCRFLQSKRPPHWLLRFFVLHFDDLAILCPLAFPPNNTLASIVPRGRISWSIFQMVVVVTRNPPDPLIPPKVPCSLPMEMAHALPLDSRQRWLHRHDLEQKGNIGAATVETSLGPNLLRYFQQLSFLFPNISLIMSSIPPKSILFFSDFFAAKSDSQDTVKATKASMRVGPLLWASKRC